MTKISIKALLLSFCILLLHGAFGQTPSISYTTPQTYIVNRQISPTAPKNIGGAVPPNLYGEVSTYSGFTGRQGSANGTLATASFYQTRKMAVDKAGIMYVLDDNNVVRKITPDGIVTQFAGSGVLGSADGLGTEATFSNPLGVCVDNAGNIFIADANNNLIRKITPAGLVSTIAGSGLRGKADGPDKSASFNFPTGIICDDAGNLFVCDQFNAMIRKITPAGIVSTLAGGNGYGLRDGPAGTATFSQPWDATLDNNGNLYVVDAYAVRKITPAGFTTTLAGQADKGGTDGTGNNASFDFLQSIAFDGYTYLYVADGFNQKIRRVTLNGDVVTLAGSGDVGFQDGIGTAASFSYPYGIGTDKAGSVYVADNQNSAIRKIAVSGYTIDKALPPGLIFDPKTGIVTGTPAAQLPATDYTITAYNAAGQSRTILNIKVNDAPAKQASVITFPILPRLIDQNNNITPTATSNNTETPIIYTSSDLSVAIITADGLIHVLKVGYTTISATQAGNSNYTDAIPAQQNLTIYQQEQIYFPPIADKHLTDADFDPKAISNVPIFPIIYTSSNPAVATIINNMVHIVGIGNTTITALQTGDDLHYSAVPQTQELTVLPGLSFGPLTAKITCDMDFAPGAVSLNPITYTSNNPSVATIIGNNIHITGPGTSTITATSNGETKQQLLIVNAIPAPKIMISASMPTPNCAGTGTITFTATPTDAGINPVYQWRVNGAPAGANSTTYESSTLVNNDVVTCTLTRTDICPNPISVTSDPFNVSGVISPLAIAVTINAANNGVYPGTSVTIAAAPLPAARVLIYQWKVNGENMGSNQPNFTSRLFRNGDVITCSITVDNPCTPPVSSDPLTIIILQPPTITITTTFTPNSDGANDTWEIPDLLFYPKCFVQIFNRYGSEVMHSTGYSKAWDGNYNGKKLPAATYYYLIDTQDGQPKLSGSVTILR